jgi:hypothetical protein
VGDWILRTARFVIVPICDSFGFSEVAGGVSACPTSCAQANPCICTEHAMMGHSAGTTNSASARLGSPRGFL